MESIHTNIIPFLSETTTKRYYTNVNNTIKPIKFVVPDSLNSKENGSF